MLSSLTDIYWIIHSNNWQLAVKKEKINDTSETDVYQLLSDFYQITPVSMSVEFNILSFSHMWLSVRIKDDKKTTMITRMWNLACCLITMEVNGESEGKLQRSKLTWSSVIKNNFCETNLHLL